MTELLNKLEVCLRQLNAPVIDLFEPPLEKESELQKFIEDHFPDNLIIPIELFELYKWHGGTNYKKAHEGILRQSYFIRDFSLMTLPEVLEVLDEREVYNFIGNRLFPFGDSFNGEYLSVKMDNDNRVFLCGVSDFEVDTITSMYDDLYRFVETNLVFFESGFYILDEDDVLRLDYDKYDEYMAVGEKMNPKSDYWRMKREFQES